MDIAEATLVERSIHKRLDPVDMKMYNIKKAAVPHEVSQRLIHLPRDTEPVVRARLAAYNATVAELTAF